MKPTQITGRLWVLRDATGVPYKDIDTDMIFHNRYLHITDSSQMGKYTLDNLKGWEDFAHRTQPGDLILAGSNFGAGSSRQQAVDCFRALGIAAIIAESFGAIYKRNAINSGLPIITFPELAEVAHHFESGDIVTVNLLTGALIRNNVEHFQTQPFSKVQLDIYLAGNLFEYGKVVVS